MRLWLILTLYKVWQDGTVNVGTNKQAKLYNEGGRFLEDVFIRRQVKCRAFCMELIFHASSKKALNLKLTGFLYGWKHPYQHK